MKNKHWMHFIFPYKKLFMFLRIKKSGDNNYVDKI